jgi:hypothetical protein
MMNTVAIETDGAHAGDFHAAVLAEATSFERSFFTRPQREKELNFGASIVCGLAWR